MDIRIIDGTIQCAKHVRETMVIDFDELDELTKEFDTKGIDWIKT